MALFLLALAGGYCFLGAFLGMRITHAPTSSSKLDKLSGNTLPESSDVLSTETPLEINVELPAQVDTETAPVTLVEQIAEQVEPLTVLADLAAPLENEPAADFPNELSEPLGDYRHLDSALEAAALALREELAVYRESLVDLETHIRVVQLNLSEISQLGVLADEEQGEELGWHGSLDSSRLQLRQLQDQWCARLAGIVRVLCKSNKPADHEDLYEEFQQHLQRTLAEQEQHREELSSLRGKSLDRESVARFVQEIAFRLNGCHALQQFIQETLISLLIRQDRLDTWESSEFIDPGTHLRNRAGLELWLRQWRGDDSNRQRQLSAILLDVDNSAALNSQWGVRIGDLILNSLGTIIHGVLRKNRGIDFTVRNSGQQYFVVLADTGPRGANSAAERIRQTIEQCYFEHPLGKIQITASAGVSDIRPHDSLNTLCDRLQRSVRTAKQAGRNCAALDEGTGPICLMAPQLRIREHSAATTITEVEQEMLNEQAELATV